MNAAIHILPTPAGLALAAAAVALGAPLFSDGLRALRLRRKFASLSAGALEPATAGFTHAVGRVELESPLFSPLGGKPCAGFQLEVVGEGRSVRRLIEVRRNFRIVAGEAVARVPGTAGRWSLSATSTRRIAPGDPVSANLGDLLGRIPEAVWLRRAGVTLELTERSLLSGRECHVVGEARSTAIFAQAQAPELARTGTDDDPVAVDELPSHAITARAAGHSWLGAEVPSVSFSGGDPQDFLLVTDAPPAAALLSVSAYRVAGIALGPLLSLAGILYLAAVADALRAVGRM